MEPIEYEPMSPLYLINDHQIVYIKYEMVDLHFSTEQCQEH